MRWASGMRGPVRLNSRPPLFAADPGEALADRRCLVADDLRLGLGRRDDALRGCLGLALEFGGGEVKVADFGADRVEFAGPVQLAVKLDAKFRDDLLAAAG